MDKKDLVLQFLKKHKIGVIATSSPEGKPEAAVVGVAVTDDFEVIFNTYPHTRKYKNIEQNNSVAFVIGWDEGITVQLEGEACEIFDQEREEARKIYYANNEEAKKYNAMGDNRCFKVTTKWLRYVGQDQENSFFELAL